VVALINEFSVILGTWGCAKEANSRRLTQS
jgi:hypothetical protein